MRLLHALTFTDPADIGLTVLAARNEAYSRAHGGTPKKETFVRALRLLENFNARKEGLARIGLTHPRPEQMGAIFKILEREDGGEIVTDPPSLHKLFCFFNRWNTSALSWAIGTRAKEETKIFEEMLF